ncbi:MAG: hypothetical protein IJU51_02145 [Clostridia bacterium]|nr:hypothetical protein [Clostridia bacterium]
MTTNRSIIKAGQFFTLLFIGRAGLTAVYSSEMSGVPSLWSFMLPLIIMVPVGSILILPALALSSDAKSPLCCESDTPAGTGRKILLLCYGAYFLYSALYYLMALLDFLRDDLPVGVEPKVIIVLILAGCVYAASKGIEAAARTSLVVMTIAAVAVILLFAFLYQGWSSDNLPAANTVSGEDFTDGTLFLISRLAACASVLVLSGSVRGRLMRGGMLWLTVSTAAIIFLITLFTGSAGAYISAKKFQVFRVIDGSGALQKSEPLFILLAVCSSFCGIALFIIASSAALSASFTRLSKPRSSLFCGLLLLTAVLFVPSEAASLIFRSKVFTASLTLVFLTLIPTVLLIRVKVKSHTWTRKHHTRAIRLTLLIILAAAFTLNSSGCTALQLSQRIIVQGMGIDADGGECRLTLITLNTVHAGQDNSISLMYSSGESVEDAVTKLEQERGKSLLLEHCLFVMLDEEAAASGEKVFGYLTGTNDMPKTANIIVSESGAEQTIKTAVNDFGYTSEDISLLTDSKAVRQPAPHCSLMELIAAEQEKRQVRLPLVTIDRQNLTLSIRPA